MKKFAVIVAGGSGKRMGGDVPKQFLPLNGKADGKPLLMYTLEAFHAYDAHIQLVLVLPESHLDFWLELCEKHHFDIPHALAFGGKERYHSVKNALLMVQQLRGPRPEKALVAVHDAVRPFVNAELLQGCYDKAAETQAVVPVVPLVDSLRRVLPDGTNQAEDRSAFCHVQTPQVFDADALWQAYRGDFQPSFTDDASVMEAAGHRITLVDGWRKNIKITTQEDLALARYWLETSE